MRFVRERFGPGRFALVLSVPWCWPVLRWGGSAGGRGLLRPALARSGSARCAVARSPIAVGVVDDGNPCARAQEVGICDFPSEKALILQESDDGHLEWVPAITTGAEKLEPQPFDASKMESLREKHDLVITGHGLELAMQSPSAAKVKEQLSCCQVMARLSPFQKEQIINAVRKGEKAFTMMCGDGGNDVGALKEADVGLALLSGFGNANVGGGDGQLAKPEDPIGAHGSRGGIGFEREAGFERQRNRFRAIIGFLVASDDLRRL